MPLTIEQERVVNHGKGNILVSASAGSGKTHTMIQRAIRLITEENVNVGEILCVTFTEKAAFEMKKKLKDTISEKILEKEDARLVSQLNEIATADISTMHAFCGRLIRSYFFAVGVAPDFKILDENEATLLKARSLEKTFNEFYDSEERWFYTLVDRHAVSRSDKKLKEIVLDAYAFGSSEADPASLMEKSLNHYTDSGFSSLINEFKRVFDKQVMRLKKQVEQVLSVFEAVDFENGVNFAKTLLADMDYAISVNAFYSINSYREYKLPASFGRIKDEDVKALKDQVMGVRDEFIKLCDNTFKCLEETYSKDVLKNQAVREHTEWFLNVLKRFSEVYEKEKQEENALDFNDLEHYALKILQDEEILETIRNKYKYIFVDEYQDTNGVQESIIDKIGNDNVFMVGDVKQSIYGFRGCRSEFFTYKDKLMTAKGQAVVRLNKNFRSAKNVIDMVNRIFSFCMTDEVYGENYRGRSELVYGQIFSDDAMGRAELHILERTEGVKVKEEPPRIYDILEEKPSLPENHTAYTSALVCDIINRELEKEIYDTEEKKFRRVNFGDICLLTRSRDSDYVRELIAGLRWRGVPVQSDTEINVLDFAEIKMLVNVLKLLDCFSQDVPLVSTLKSPIANLTDEELMDVALAFRNDNKHGNFYQAYQHYIEYYDTSLKEKLLNFDTYFKSLRFVSDFLGAHGVLEKVINENNFKAHFLATTGGSAKITRIERFVSASIVNNKNLTVKEFLNKIETCPKAFGLLELDGENTIRAMTIHSSKGLEFPIVIVCGLERAFNDEDDSKEILFDRNVGFAVKRYDDEKRIKEETVLRGVIKTNARIERQKEEARLFYVATTRAQYSLHLVCSVKADKREDEFIGANCFMDFIPSYIPATYHSERDFSLSMKIKEQRKVLVGKADSDSVAKMKEDFSYTYPFIADTTLPLKNTVTAVVKEQKQDYYPVHVLFDDDAPDAERGTIAHKVLELYDFYSTDDVVSQTNKMVDLGQITKEQLGKINLDRLDRALKGGAFDSIKNATLYREKSFIVGIEGDKITNALSKEKVLLQGVIDLLAITSLGAEIVDYKYSSLDEKTLKDRYKKQLELYAYAVETVLGIKVIKTSLVNLFSGDTIVVE